MFSSLRRKRLMEMTVDDKNQDSRTAIAVEAVGERDGSETPDTATEEAKLRSQENARRVATAAPSHAKTADIAAEVVGERVGDAYPDTTTDEARERSRNVVRQAAKVGSQSSAAANEMVAAGRQAAQVVSRQFGEQPVLTVVAGLVLGYIVGLLIHFRPLNWKP
jgi:hypothetical protein